MDFTGERYIPENSPADVAYEHWHRYFYAQQFVAGRNVLDIACGVGYGSALLAGTAASVVGVDLDPETVSYASSRHVLSNLSFATGSVADIPVPGKAVFDVIVSFETIEHVDAEAQAAFLREVKRLLKPDGLLLISTPDANFYNDRVAGYKNPFHVREFDRQGFLAFLGGAFAQVACVSQCPVWGSYIHVPGREAGRLVAYGMEYGESGIKPVRDAAENTYLIAVCSNAPVPELPFSVSIDKSHQHFKELLRDQATHRNRWAATEAELRQGLDAASAEVDRTQERLAAADRELHGAREALATAERQIREQSTVLDQQKGLVQLLADREATVTALRRQVEGILVSHAKAEETLAGQSDQIRVLERHRAGLESELKVSKERGVAMQSRLAELTGRLDLARKELAEVRASLVREQTGRERLDAVIAQHCEAVRAESAQVASEQSRLADGQTELVSLQERLLDEQSRQIETIQRLTVRLSEESLHGEELLHQLRKTDELRRDAEQELARTKLGISFRIGRAVTWLPRVLRGGDASFRVPAWVRVPLIVLRHPVKTLRCFSWRNLRQMRYHLSGKSPFDGASVLSNYLSGNGLHPAKPTEFDPVLPDASAQRQIVLPAAADPKVTIVVPVYNQWAYTRSCLASLAVTTDGIPVEVIVIDDGSTDETSEAIRAVEGVRYVRNRTNLGFLRNCNKAAAKARGEYVLFLNNDTNPQPGWLAALVAVLEGDPTVGIVGSKLVYADGTLQEAGGIVWRDASGWNYGKGDDPEKPEYNYRKDVDYVSGAALMVRRDLWRKLGGFDERYAPAYFEDSDLCFACRREGFRVVYEPTSVVVHHEGKTCGTDLGSGIKQYQQVNAAKFREKWAEVLDRDQFPNPQRLDAPEVFVARDRSKDKACLLVVDHHVPFFDQDAGSRSCLHFLRLFVEQGYNVKFIGDNFYRHEPYTSILQRLGIEVLYGVWFCNGKWKDWLRANGGRFACAFVQRPHIAPPYIEALREFTKAKVVYYGVDLHYLRLQRQYEVERSPQLKEEAERWRDIELDITRKVDLSVYLSPVETEAVAKAVPGATTQVIPMFVHDFFDHSPAAYDPKARSGVLCVGGFGHAPNADAVHWLLDSVLPLVWKELPDLVLHVVGSKMPPEIKALENERVIMHGALSDEELSAQYARCRVALVPLRYGAGMKGKVVEALEAGVPMVSTSIGLEGFTDLDPRIVATDSAEAFATRIVALIRDDALASALSEAQRTYIAKFFAKDRAKRVFSDVLVPGSRV